ALPTFDQRGAEQPAAGVGVVPGSLLAGHLVLPSHPEKVRRCAAAGTVARPPPEGSADVAAGAGVGTGGTASVVGQVDEGGGIIGGFDQSDVEVRSEEHTSELQSREAVVCRL